MELFNDDDQKGRKGRGAAPSRGGAGGAGETHALRVNQQWAEQYNARKRRQELGKAREEGRLQETLAQAGDDGASVSSTSSSSSDEGEALTPAVNLAVLRTIQMIKAKDPRVYDSKHDWFEGVHGGPAAGSGADGGKPAQARRMRARDVVREQVLEAAREGREDAFHDDDSDAGDADRDKRGPTYVEEQAALKASFAAAADAADSGSESDAGGFRVKQKTASERAAEQADFEAWVKKQAGLTKTDETGEGTTDTAEAGAGAGGGSAVLRTDAERDALRRYLATDKLSPEDAFLREYVLKQRWRLPDSDDERTGDPLQERIIRADAKDEAALDAADDYERMYNFRFEEGDGTGGGAGRTHLVSHARGAGDSLRRTDNKRARARAERKRRKEEEKREREAELRRLRRMRQQELEAQLRAVKEAAGTGVQLPETVVSEEAAGAGAGASAAEQRAKALLDMDAEWDPAAHDAAMAQAFGDEYYEVTEGGTTAGAADGSSDEAAGDSDGADGEEAVGADEKPVFPFVPGIDDMPISDDDGALGAAPDDKETEERAIKERAAAKAEEEVAALHYEDVAGGVKTRFPYRKVPAADYGLEPDDILLAEERQLNAIVSLRRLAPFRETEWTLPGRKRRRDVASLRKRIAEEVPAILAAREAEERAKTKAGRRAAKREGERGHAEQDTDAAAGAAPDEQAPKEAAAQAQAGKKRRKRKPRSERRQAAVPEKAQAAAEASSAGHEAKASDAAADSSGAAADPAAAAAVRKGKRSRRGKAAAATDASDQRQATDDGHSSAASVPGSRLATYAFTGAAEHKARRTAAAVASIRAAPAGAKRKKHKKEKKAKKRRRHDE